MRSQSSAELVTIHGFGEEIVGSGGQCDHPGGAIVEGGEDDDPNVLGGRVTLDLGRHLVTVHAWHQHVDQDEVGRLMRYSGERLFAAGSAHDQKTLAHENELQ